MTEINLQDWVGRSSTEEDIASGVNAARLATLLEQDVLGRFGPAAAVPCWALAALRRGRRSDERTWNRWSREARWIHAPGRTASAHVGRQ